MHRPQHVTSNKPVDIKYHNQKLVLALFRQTGALSVAEIADKTKLSKTTVAKILDGFERKRLVLALGKGASTDVGGKKPERFAFNPNYANIITLTITHDKVIGAVSNLKCNLSCQREVDCGTNIGYRETLELLSQLVLDLMRDADLTAADLCAIVLGCEGIVDAENGILNYALYHPWDNKLSIRDDLARLLPFSVAILVDNNARLAGYAHMILNADQYGTIAVISTYHYAGGCLMEAKKLVRGANGFVGEFGHMILEPDSDVRCHCGCNGCFGALVAPETVLAEAAERGAHRPNSTLAPVLAKGSLTIEDIFEAANEGDVFARELLDLSVRYFALLIHNITILCDPVKFIIQGIYTNAGPYFLDSLMKKVGSLPFYKTERPLSVSFTPIPVFNAYLVGAAYYAVDEFLDDNSLYD